MPGHFNIGFTLRTYTYTTKQNEASQAMTNFMEQVMTGMWSSARNAGLQRCLGHTGNALLKQRKSLQAPILGANQIQPIIHRLDLLLHIPNNGCTDDIALTVHDVGRILLSADEASSCAVLFGSAVSCVVSPSSDCSDSISPWDVRLSTG